MTDQSTNLVRHRETAFNAGLTSQGITSKEPCRADGGWTCDHLTPSRTSAEVDCPAITLGAARPVETVPSRPRSTLRICTQLMLLLLLRSQAAVSHWR
jgi:hypothetical protein